jgi:hypothetical protein
MYWWYQTLLAIIFKISEYFSPLALIINDKADKFLKQRTTPCVAGYGRSKSTSACLLLHQFTEIKFNSKEKLLI